jgi:predicted nucleic acid-binding protein
LIYCDSSFLVSLYVGTESLSSAAREMADCFEEPIAFHWLNELEVLTTLHRTQRPAALNKTLAAIDAARSDGLLAQCLIEQEVYSRRSLELARRHVAHIQCRSLDILHVALALETQTPYFVSFDRGQRQLAQAVRLKILPEDLDDC